MGHTIRIMYSTDDTHGGAAVATTAHKDAVLEETARQLLESMPRIVRTLKQSARHDEAFRAGLDKEVGDSQMWVLHMLAHGNQLTTELARRFNVTNPTMTRIIDALVEHGYVERRPDPSDRRCLTLSLTEQGKEAAKIADERFHSAVVDFLRPLSEQQLADVKLAMGHLRSLLPSEGDRSARCPADAVASVQGLDSTTNTATARRN